MIAQRDHLLEEKEQQLGRQEQRIDALTERLAFFEEQFRLLQAKQFGSSSEQSPLAVAAVQRGRAGRGCHAGGAGADDHPSPAPSRAAKHCRRTCRRNVSNTPSAEEQICACCGGALHAMSTETREELQFIPAQLKRIEHVRHVYGCRQCERTGESVPIVTAPAPKPPIPKSYASASLLAYIIVAKFVDGLPLYRLEAHFERLGISLSRQVMSIWMIRVALLLEPVFDRLTEQLRRRTILHADETTLQVLQEPERTAQSNPTCGCTAVRARTDRRSCSTITSRRGRANTRRRSSPDSGAICMWMGMRDTTRWKRDPGRLLGACAPGVP